MALRHTFQAALRSTLRLDLRTAPVTILKGDMEKFVVESKTAGADDHLDVLPTRGDLEVVQRRPGRVDLSVTIPERYCSVHATTAGAGVRLECINEASLLVDTTSEDWGQGPISAGSVKATTAVLSSTGAPISARKLTAEVASLVSEGGPITVQHLIAKTAIIDSSLHESAQADAATGAITLTTGYATSLRLTTGGGPISCQHVDTQSGTCHMDSRGGSIDLGGLDGSAELHSRGGGISVVACDNIQSLQLTSSGGPVSCSMSPGALMSGAIIHARAGGAVAWPEQDVEPSQREAHMRMAGTKAAQQALAQQGPAGGGGDVGNMASRAARVGEADAVAAAAAAHASASEPQEAVLGPAGDAGGGFGEGWETRTYFQGQQVGAEAVKGVQCSRVVLDAGAGPVTISIMSWIASMKAKMAAGQ